jgi:glycine/serine hydroxymethyltransferase
MENGKNAMLSYKEAVQQFQELDEKLIILGKSAYPKFGHVVLLGGGAGCFSGETLVKTEEGYIPIMDVKAGMKALTFNETSKKTEFKEVNKLITFEPEDITENLIELTFENGEKVICTESHKFFVDGEWIKAIDL